MNTPSVYNNPYRPLADEDVTRAPFVGREKTFEYLYKQLTNPLGAQTSVVLGRYDIGKTSLLRHFGDYFDETFIGVYIPLKDHPFTNEGDWLRALVNETNRTLTELKISMSRPPEKASEEALTREWFTSTYLPEVLRIIRQRRLVFLLDDAGALVKALQEGRLPADIFTSLDNLLKENPQLGVVLAMDSRYEDQVAAMNPLVSVTNIFRLTNLSEEETQQLLRDPAVDRYHVSDEAVGAVYKASGGQPRLVQRFGFHLYRRWEGKMSMETLTLKDIRQISPTVYIQSEEDFQKLWGQLSRNERLSLTAITHLLYSDPLASIQSEAVEGWLVESDYPLDRTAIQSAVRGLEYNEVVEQANGGVRVAAGLMQTWLLEHARLTETGPRRRISAWGIIAILVLLVAVLLFIVSQRNTNTPAAEIPSAPTVTLVGGS